MSEEKDRTERLSGVRVEKAVYLARNDRGAEVRIGSSDTDGVFSPGELLQIAAAACAALTADHILSGRLGDDFDASFTVTGDGVRGENRYSGISTKVVADMSMLEDKRQEVLLTRALKAIERLCSVGRTVEQGATTEVELIPDSLDL